MDFPRRPYESFCATSAFILGSRDMVSLFFLVCCVYAVLASHIFPKTFWEFFGFLILQRCCDCQGQSSSRDFAVCAG